MLRNIRKKPRRKLILEKDDDDEEIDIDENTKKKEPSQRRQLTMDEIYHNIKSTTGLASFKQIKFEKLSNGDKEKVEEAMLDMSCIVKMTPLQMGNLIPNELYKRIDQKWQYAMMTEK